MTVALVDIDPTSTSTTTASRGHCMIVRVVVVDHPPLSVRVDVRRGDVGIRVVVMIMIPVAHAAVPVL